MPKLKTKSSIKKRFARTGTGKIKFKAAGKRHGMSKRSNKFIRNTSINTTTMIISRSILGTHKFKNINLLEDYLFKCELLKKKNIVAKKLNENLAFYRILSNSRSRQRLKNAYWLWNINRNYNKLNFFLNLISIFCVAINSIKKYGIK